MIVSMLLLGDHFWGRHISQAAGGEHYFRRRGNEWEAIGCLVTMQADFFLQEVPYLSVSFETNRTAAVLCSECSAEAKRLGIENLSPVVGL